MLSLKLYTDTSEFQSLLRKSYWTTSTLKTKKYFYNWAIELYRTILYHSTPIENSIFHGKLTTV